LASSANPSVFGQSVILTATVSSAAGTPTGTVTFQDAATTLGTASLNAAGQATCMVSSLAVGSHGITAIYGGGAGFSGSTSASLAQTVNRASTLTQVSAPAVSGTDQSISFTATVSAAAPGSGTPSGTVQFQIDAVDFGAPVALANGVAQSTATSSLSRGVHTITAAYSPDAGFSSSSGSAQIREVTPPANDNFANSILLSGVSATSTVSTVGAGKEPGEPNHAGNAGGHSVWWTWVAPDSGNVQIDTVHSTFDTLLAVYTGSAVNALTAVPDGSNGNDPSGGTLTSKVVFAVKRGTVYRLAVDGSNGATGTAKLRVNYSTTPPAAPTGVSASDGASASMVLVTWNAVSGATGYQVWRSTSNRTGKARESASSTSLEHRLTIPVLWRESPTGIGSSR